MKNKLKGMTLMEIVVSMAVYGVLALLVIEIMSLVNATMRETDHMNKRLSYETKYADNYIIQDKGDAFDMSPIKVNIDYDMTRDAHGKLSHQLGADLPGGSHFLGNIYTAHLSTDSGEKDVSGDPIYDVDRSGVNYRFMTFTKLSGGTTSVFKSTFDVSLDFSAIDGTGVEKVVVYDCDRSGIATATPHTYTDLSGVVVFSASNADAKTGTSAVGTHTIFVEFYKKMSEGGTLKSTAEVCFDTDLQYCTYVTPASVEVPSGEDGKRIYIDGTSYSFEYTASTGKYSVLSNG